MEFIIALSLQSATFFGLIATVLLAVFVKVSGEGNWRQMIVLLVSGTFSTFLLATVLSIFGYRD